MKRAFDFPSIQLAQNGKLYIISKIKRNMCNDNVNKNAESKAAVHVSLLLGREGEKW